MNEEVLSEEVLKRYEKELRSRVKEKQSRLSSLIRLHTPMYKEVEWHLLLRTLSHSLPTSKAIQCEEYFSAKSTQEAFQQTHLIRTVHFLLLPTEQKQEAKTINQVKVSRLVNKTEDPLLQQEQKELLLDLLLHLLNHKVVKTKRRSTPLPPPSLEERLLLLEQALKSLKKVIKNATVNEITASETPPPTARGAHQKDKRRR